MDRRILEFSDPGGVRSTRRAAEFVISKLYVYVTSNTRRAILPDLDAVYRDYFSWSRLFSVQEARSVNFASNESLAERFLNRDSDVSKFVL